MFAKGENGVVFAKKESTCAGLSAFFEGEEFVEGGGLYRQCFGVVYAFEILINEHKLGIRLSSFLALMQEKNQKKIKASAEAGEAVRVHEILRYVSGKLRRRPQPPSLDRRKEAKEDQGVRDAGQFGLVRDMYLIRFLFFVFRLSSFLALMQEKKQKKIKASAEAGEAGRVLYGM